MKRISTLLMLMILLTSLQSYEQGFSPQVKSRLQVIIDSFQNNPENPFVGGMSVAIKVDQLAQWQGATGYSARNVDDQNNLLPGGTPFTVHTLSRIYSITKTFTAPLVLQLANEGAFKLDDPLDKFIPIQAINPGLDGKVTIQQLLAHESGYSDYVDEFNLQIAVAAQPTHVWTPYEMLSFVHQVSQPGAERRYASTNYIALGAIVEAATGKLVQDLYRERFFKPLHLNSMYLDIREQKNDRRVLAAPHDNISAFNPVFQQTGQPLFPDAYTNISQFPLTAIASLAFTGGGIISDAKDVAEWSSALFSGRAAGKHIINTMLKSISETPDDDGDRLGYGLILSNKISGTYDFYGHDGNAPGYRSIMFYQPGKKLTIVILTNYHGANLYTIAKKLYETIPDFSCGNERDEKVTVCFWGKNLCLPRPIASWLIHYGGYVGGCAETRPPGSNSNEQPYTKLNEATKITDKLQAFPNPFTNIISFSFRSPGNGNATLKLYDMNGRLIATIFSGAVQKGSLQKLNFDGSKLPAGIYLGRLQTAAGVSEQKLIKIR